MSWRPGIGSWPAKQRQRGYAADSAGTFACLFTTLPRGHRHPLPSIRLRHVLHRREGGVKRCIGRALWSNFLWIGKRGLMRKPLWQGGFGVAPSPRPPSELGGEGAKQFGAVGNDFVVFSMNFSTNKASAKDEFFPDPRIIRTDRRSGTAPTAISANQVSRQP